MKVVITAALTGVLAKRQQCPAIPYTAREIAEEARRSLDAGASIIHIHARQENGDPAFDVESYRRIDEAVSELCPEAILNYSTGAVGVDRQTRIAPIQALKPAMAALNMGSMNYAIYSSKKKAFYQDHIFANPFGDIQFYLEAMREAGTLPEMECFDCGHIQNAQPLAEMGLLPQRQCFSLVMGVLGGIPAHPRHLLHQVDSLPKEAHWQCITIGEAQWRLLPVAIALGGHIRVGLEDNFYLPSGEMAGSNGQLVESAARLVAQMGGSPASPGETRQLLGLSSYAAH